ncbi:DNA polymerase III subunit delta [Hydrogenimonas sp.]
MYKREFDQLLRSGPLPKSLMLYGDNDYYIDEAVEKITGLLDAGESMLKLYYDEYDFSRAKTHLGQSSLFGDLNLLLIRSDRKIPKKELTHLVELAARNENSYFLYIYAGSDFKSMTTLFSPKQRAQHVRFFPSNLNEAAALLQKKAQQLGIEIDRYAVEHLLNALGLNLSMAVNELNKLALLSGPIGTKEIDEHIFSLVPVAMESFLVSLFSKRPLADLLRQVQHLSEDEFAVLRSIQYFATQLFLFHAHIKLHGSADSSAVLGYRLPKPIEQQRAQLAARISPEGFEKIFDALAEGELAIKTAGASSQKETLLLSTLIKIKSFLG